MSVILTVHCSLADGITDQDFISAAQRCGSYLKRCPGFLGRKLSYNEARRQWLDLVYWQTLEHALAAERTFNDDPTNRELINSIKPGSLVVQHYEVKSEL
ncbi:antibiotic biosynthesis monooxygenase family protein [Gallaecimonas mangrovi]|uniref:antibiotic biosynthesis monooxygenase family protein n=1 Tax=Gallaecimonas mangrovi TaxID=2291597 RepID=UPI000E201B2E|nr:hypothetical protein [Gallaecimonas mangrovi]